MQRTQKQDYGACEEVCSTFVHRWLSWLLFKLLPLFLYWLENSCSRLCCRPWITGHNPDCTSLMPSTIRLRRLSWSPCNRSHGEKRQHIAPFPLNLLASAAGGAPLHLTVFWCMTLPRSCRECIAFREEHVARTPWILLCLQIRPWTGHLTHLFHSWVRDHWVHGLKVIGGRQIGWCHRGSPRKNALVLLLMWRNCISSRETHRTIVSISRCHESSSWRGIWLVNKSFGRWHYGYQPLMCRRWLEKPRVRSVIRRLRSWRWVPKVRPCWPCRLIICFVNGTSMSWNRRNPSALSLLVSIVVWFRGVVFFVNNPQLRVGTGLWRQILIGHFLQSNARVLFQK